MDNMIAQAKPRFLSVLVGVNEIARRLANGKGSVVANWRSRSTTFPAPKWTGSQPKFDMFEVLSWLEEDGPKGRTVPEIRQTWWWEKVVEAYADQADDLEPRRTLIAFVLLRYLLHNNVPKGEQLWAALATDGSEQSVWHEAAAATERHCPNAADLLLPMLGEVANPAALRDLIPFLDKIQERHTERQLRPILELDLRQMSTREDPHRTAALLAQLVAALAMPKRGDKVFDPAAGEGQLLVECSDFARVVDLYGQEIDSQAWEVSASRTMVLGETTARLAQPGHDSLTDDQFPDLRAEVVVLDPPLDDKMSNLDLWLEHGYRHVADDGRFVMVLPAHQLVRVLSSRRRPDPLLRNAVDTLVGIKAVEAVAVLPRRVRRDVVGPLLVLVLRRGVEVDRPVLISYRAEGASIRSAPRIDAFVSALKHGFSGGGYEHVRSIPPYVYVERTEPQLLVGLTERMVESLELGEESMERQPRQTYRESDDFDGLTLDPSTPSASWSSLKRLSEPPLSKDSLTYESAAQELERLLRPLLKDLSRTDSRHAAAIERALAQLRTEHEID